LEKSGITIIININVTTNLTGATIRSDNNNNNTTPTSKQQAYEVEMMLVSVEPSAEVNAKAELKTTATH
jgi:hypothetical protein